MFLRWRRCGGSDIRLTTRGDTEANIGSVPRAPLSSCCAVQSALKLGSRRVRQAIAFRPNPAGRGLLRASAAGNRSWHRPREPVQLKFPPAAAWTSMTQLDNSIPSAFTTALSTPQQFAACSITGCQVDIGAGEGERREATLYHHRRHARLARSAWPAELSCRLHHGHGLLHSRGATVDRVPARRSEGKTS